ncbi:OLC1v1004426C1 [Oldenlandia corymbosa var. corymbosa]|uniref:OLC1v1004426C1 n=1 Tax=Oldenlandia corymbosa var. corymbosa TaxID=529605 RepID=A0AAV1DER0_OLDCO|nr:OLC1v1004426C1 [Oldenlandia corymbosa var. corymbosa]
MESIHLPICPQPHSDIVTIQIKGIGLTTLPAVQYICRSVGALEGLSMDGKDAVKAFYRVKNHSKLRKILTRLNNTVINSHRWSATVLSDKEEDGDNSKLVLQLNNRVADLWSHLMTQKMWLEDLEYLHMGILHLQGLPTNADS